MWRICFNTEIKNEKENEKEKENGLIREVLSGGECAFRELTGPYIPALYNYIKIKAPGHADTEDILQETMLAVWQGLAGYSGQSAFKTWMFSVAKRKIADFYRKSRAGIEFDGEIPEDIAAADVWEATDGNLDLYDALSKLPEEHRELIYLVFYAGLTYEEIQNLTGMKTGTIKSRIHHIKKTLYYMLTGGD